MPSEKEIEAITPILERGFCIIGSGNVEFKESIRLTAKLVLEAAEKVRAEERKKHIIEKGGYLTLNYCSPEGIR